MSDSMYDVFIVQFHVLFVLLDIMFFLMFNCVFLSALLYALLPSGVINYVCMYNVLMGTLNHTHPLRGGGRVKTPTHSIYARG